ncbi:MAG: FAD-binding protein [Propionibacteriaceae bacterium]|jgi:succinate dehydrogenase/fumarate reductase flavoprotein subunit|nr:FAD-binding protein [Propionibacteriaceae bacterium]
MAPAIKNLTVSGRAVPTLTAPILVVGAGAAAYRAAEALADLGAADLVVVTDQRNAGTSRNAGSDKQTYYKLTLAGAAPDSVRELAETLYAGGAVDGDNALAEAAWSARGFLHLVDVGVPFPVNRYGEFPGYKTDHDPRQRATSAGPLTSRTMVERLEARVRARGVPVLARCRAVDLVVADTPAGRRAVGLLALRTDQPADRWLLIRAAHIVWATGGPAGLWAASAFPHGQWGATGAALRAGAAGQNLTEWQFGLASLAPRWNVSGSYLQAIPHLVSTDAAGGDARDFLADALPDRSRRETLTFLKGYEWPFDVRKAEAGSSLIDLLVHRELTLAGRRVWLDFRARPDDPPFDPARLGPAARDYLTRAGVTADAPVDRLRQLNEPAYRFYLDRSDGVDLAAQPLEVGLGAQHHNGGLAVDAWWRTSLAGLYAVGEAAGAHGVYRPGGAALNSGQVGAMRAAAVIAAHPLPLPDPAAFACAAAPVLSAAEALVADASRRHRAGAADTTASQLARLQALMSQAAGPVRSRDGLAAALAEVRRRRRAWPAEAVADPASRRTADRLILIRDLLTTAEACLAAMADLAERQTGSRGSALLADPAGRLPGAAAGLVGDLPEAYRFSLDGGALDDLVQETAWDEAADQPVCRWRPRRPLPDTSDEVFENVWRDFRADGNVR